MPISFLHDKPGIYTLNHTIAFTAVLKGKTITCEITEEALRECFAADPAEGLSKSEYDAAMVDVFEQNRKLIEQAASRCLNRNSGSQICLLTSKDF